MFLKRSKNDRFWNLICISQKDNKRREKNLYIIIMQESTKKWSLIKRFTFENEARSL